MAVLKVILVPAMAVVLLAVGPAGAAYEYTVTGVAAGDVLNIRDNVAAAESAGSAKIVGTIPANATGVAGTGVTILLGRTRWHEISFNGVTGWVSGRYLAPAPDGDATPPTDLACSGTEPFWSMQFSEGRAVRRHATGELSGGGVEYSVLPPVVAVGRTHVWAMSISRKGSGGTGTAVFLRTDMCSDGMSDFTYPIEFVLSDADGGQTVLSGCCSLRR